MATDRCCSGFGHLIDRPARQNRLRSSSLLERTKTSSRLLVLEHKMTSHSHNASANRASTNRRPSCGIRRSTRGRSLEFERTVSSPYSQPTCKPAASSPSVSAKTSNSRSSHSPKQARSTASRHSSLVPLGYRVATLVSQSSPTRMRVVSRHWRTNAICRCSADLCGRRAVLRGGSHCNRECPTKGL